MAAPSDSDREPEAVPAVNPATVSSLLLNVRELLHSEQSKEQSLLSRASSLVGFAGLLVPLSIVGGAGIFSLRLSTSWEYAAFSILAIGLTCLAGALAIAVIGVNHPRESVGIAIAEVAMYPTYALVSLPTASVEGRTMRGLIEVLASERRRNGSRAQALRWADGLFLGAMAAFVAVGGILGAHAMRFI